MTARPRPPTGPSVGTGSASVEGRPGTWGVPDAVTNGRSLPTSSSPRAARAALSSSTSFAITSGLLKSLPNARWTTPSACAAPARRTSRSARPPRSGSAPAASAALRGRVGTGEREDGVAVAEQLGDDGGPDQAGATGDEDTHGAPPRVMGLLSRHSYQGDGTRVPSHMMDPWVGGNQAHVNASSWPRSTCSPSRGTTPRRSRRSPSVPASPKAPSSGTSPTSGSCWSAGQETLSRLLTEGIAEAPRGATPLEAVAAGLERASSAMGPMNRELAPRAEGGHRCQRRAAGA